MDRWEHVRRRATACHAEARRAGADASAASLVAKGLELAGLERKAVRPGEVGHDGTASAKLEAAVRKVYVSSELSSVDADAAVAHELGHHHLHVDPVLDDVAPSADGRGAATRRARDEAPSSSDGYSPRQVKELQANLFGDEFLCPSNWLRGRLRDGTPLSQVATAIGAPLDLVRRQAVAALVRSDAPRPPPELPCLDSEQARCVGRRGGTLVLGGPGSGKTTALLAHLLHLLRRGVPPADTLTLVATGHAAETGRAILAREGARIDGEAHRTGDEPDACGRADTEAWVGTPFDLALEIVVRWPRRAGFDDGVASLDRTSALALLKGVMDRESDTTREGGYVRRALAEIDVMRDRRAAGLRPRRNAPALDAAVAAAYEDALKTRNAVDGGGLVPAAVAALRNDVDLLEHLRSRFRHVLVDDLHDLKASEQALVALLAPEGHALWATSALDPTVGRSRPADGTVVTEVSARGDVVVARLVRDHRPKAGPLAVLRQFRGDRGGPGPVPSGSTSLTVSPDVRGEAAAIAARMRRLVTDGVPWGEQALIGAAHSVVDHLASELRRMGVPLAHPGDVPARPDVRGLVGLVLLAKDGSGARFAEAAALPPYGIPAVAAATVKRWARERREPLRAVLGEPRAIPGLARNLLPRLARLGRDLDVLKKSPTLPFLLDLMVGEGGLVRDLLSRDRDGSRASDLIALHHLLRTCEEHDHDVAQARKAAGRDDAGSGREGARLRERVGRIGSLLQATHFRHVSPSSAGLDAVAVLTIRESRGREFEAVHLCGANAFRSGDDREPLLAALTRARTHLHVTRARMHEGVRTKPSPHLATLAPVLPQGAGA